MPSKRKPTNWPMVVMATAVSIIAGIMLVVFLFFVMWGVNIKNFYESKADLTPEQRQYEFYNDSRIDAGLSGISFDEWNLQCQESERLHEETMKMQDKRFQEWADKQAPTHTWD